MGQGWDPFAGPAKVYGEVYELITGDPQDGEHPYVGKAKDAYERVYGRGGHTSRASIAKAPWKARILQAPHGFGVLQQIVATGDDEADERSLRLAEAYWIDQLKTTYNTHRPAYEHGNPRAVPRKRPAARRATARPVTHVKPVKPVRRPTKAELRARRRWQAFAILSVLFTALYVWRNAQVGAGMQALALSLPFGVATALPTFFVLDHIRYRITRKR